MVNEKELLAVVALSFLFNLVMSVVLNVRVISSIYNFAVSNDKGFDNIENECRNTQSKVVGLRARFKNIRKQINRGFNRVENRFSKELVKSNKILIDEFRQEQNKNMDMLLSLLFKEAWNDGVGEVDNPQNSEGEESENSVENVSQGNEESENSFKNISQGNQEKNVEKRDYPDGDAGFFFGREMKIPRNNFFFHKDTEPVIEHEPVIEPWIPKLNLDSNQFYVERDLPLEVNGINCFVRENESPLVVGDFDNIDNIDDVDDVNNIDDVDDFNNEMD